MPILVELAPVKRRPLLFKTAEGPKFLSAASGLVRSNDKIYVIADNDLKLGILDSVSTESSLVTLLPGTLPTEEKALKKHKPDFESLFAINDPRLPSTGLIAFPSGSSKRRFTGVFIPILGNGLVHALGIIRFDLGRIFTPILEDYGQLNIEASLIDGEQLVLFHRGNSLSDMNRMFEFNKSEFIDLILGEMSGQWLRPRSMKTLELGALDGVKLTVTAATIFEGRTFFLAAAEDTANSFDDGDVRGTVLGEIQNSGQCRVWGTIAKQKTEGLSLRRFGSFVEVSMVTDNDDPHNPSELVEFAIDIP
jgi:hypothetical protein